jgi:predicted nucleic acid-binding protein
MKVYLDACCLNRPFDDQSQDRIRLESESIIIILNLLYKGEGKWLGSEALEIEIENSPNIEKRNYLKRMANFVHKTIKIQNKETTRAKQLVEVGFKAFDAMHIACAESEKADVFLTTDDKLLNLAKRNKNKLNIDIRNPVLWLLERL